eukprot:TRINITY_DN4513_c0_g1_i1.p1 TRINITY_DN4513_c0_g1~~TRINITY_DN4513_c0_g1_i1.p1  ORF type:complete len:684 (+),score=113.78 TRINITY_DN4513_c0_g1_i1:128-2179(+)
MEAVLIGCSPLAVLSATGVAIASSCFPSFTRRRRDSAIPSTKRSWSRRGSVASAASSEACSEPPSHVLASVNARCRFGRAWKGRRQSVELRGDLLVFYPEKRPVGRRNSGLNGNAAVPEPPAVADAAVSLLDVEPEMNKAELCLKDQDGEVVVRIRLENASEAKSLANVFQAATAWSENAIAAVEAPGTAPRVPRRDVPKSPFRPNDADGFHTPQSIAREFVWGRGNIADTGSQASPRPQGVKGIEQRVVAMFLGMYRQFAEALELPEEFPPKSGARVSNASARSEGSLPRSVPKSSRGSNASALSDGSSQRNNATVGKRASITSRTSSSADRSQNILGLVGSILRGLHQEAEQPQGLCAKRRGSHVDLGRIVSSAIKMNIKLGQMADIPIDEPQDAGLVKEKESRLLQRRGSNGMEGRVLQTLSRVLEAFHAEAKANKIVPPKIQVKSPKYPLPQVNSKEIRNDGMEPPKIEVNSKEIRNDGMEPPTFEVKREEGRSSGVMPPKIQGIGRPPPVAEAWPTQANKAPEEQVQQFFIGGDVTPPPKIEEPQIVGADLGPPTFRMADDDDDDEGCVHDQQLASRAQLEIIRSHVLAGDLWRSLDSVTSACNSFGVDVGQKAWAMQLKGMSDAQQPDFDLVEETLQRMMELGYEPGKRALRAAKQKLPADRFLALCAKLRVAPPRG